MPSASRIQPTIVYPESDGKPFRPYLDLAASEAAAIVELRKQRELLQRTMEQLRAAERRAESAENRAESAEHRAKKLAEHLRRLGIDPDSV